MSSNAGTQHISSQERRSRVSVSCWKEKSHKGKESKAGFDEVLEVM